VSRNIHRCTRSTCARMRAEEKKEQPAPRWAENHRHQVRGGEHMAPRDLERWVIELTRRR
jgi:hypothetical protein